MSVITNIKKRGFKDILSKRVFAYLESKWQSIFGVRIKKDDAIAYAEQIIFKRSMCAPCYAKGECLHCGCNFRDLSVSTEATCSQGRWGKTLNSKDWQSYKEKYLHGIDFGFIKFNKDEFKVDDNN